MTARDLGVLLDRMAAMVQGAAGDRRRVLGIAGGPGAGKTSLVIRLLEGASRDPRLAERVAHVPMDGFHRTDADLDELGRRHRKGAPDTFDAAAYAATLASLRALPRRVVTAPAFDHAVGDPAPDAITVPGSADLVVTEGNYLLLGGPVWGPVREQLDEVWFCALADEVRRERLVVRHIGAGRDRADAVAWAERSDEANARLVAATRGRADLVIIDGQLQ